ncbi:MAG: FUSC family protein, partial [Phycisphaerales bacterium]|nr:FUSC family protein [Phycisphaerales bacterium]
AVVTTVLVIQPTIGASLAKARQRIAGALVGAIFGVVLLATAIANTNDLAGILAVIFVVSLITGWLMAGPWDTAYSGLQFGLVLVMTFLGTDYPTASLSEPVNRIWGILLGLAVSGIVLRVLWPVRATDRLLESLAQCMRTMADTLDVGLRDPREEERLRPMHGWRYRMAWLLADAYRFREEARFEHGIGFDQGMPALRLGVSMQDAMLRTLLIVRNRIEHPEWKDILHRHAGALELRQTAQAAMRSIAQVLEGERVEEVDLASVRATALAQTARQFELQGQDRAALDTHVGYFDQLLRAIEPMYQEAAEVRARFKGRT